MISESSMSVTAGVDGGQSEIRLRVAGEPDPRIADGVSRLEGDAITAVVKAIDAAWRQGPAVPLARVVLGLTTAPHTEEGRARLAHAVAAVLGAGEVWVTEDIVTAHAGALPGGHGVVVAAGTGVACLAVDSSSGRTHVVDGTGYLLGDDGGGFWIGRAGVAAVLRGIDGRGPRSGLRERAETRYGSLADLAARLHSSPRAVSRIAGFTPDVLACALDGDAVARAIVERAADELARTAAAGVSAIAGDDGVPVALGGRVLVNSAHLRDLIALRLGTDCVRARPHLALGAPLDGACLLADRSTPGPYGPLVHRHREVPA